MPTPEEILKFRAKILAQELKDEKSEFPDLEALSFLLAHETYLIPAEHILGITFFRGLTLIPCTPSFVLGVMNWHGKIVSVLDLKKFFHLPETEIMDLSRVILLTCQGLELGVLVDRIAGICSVRSAEIQKLLDSREGVSSEYIIGLDLEQRILLNVEKLFSDRKMIVHEEVKR